MCRTSLMLYLCVGTACFFGMAYGGPVATNDGSYSFLDGSVSLRANLPQNPECSAEALTNAAKCKCALLSHFLPDDDYRIKFCTATFGDNLHQLEGHCGAFAGGATAYKGLAAMFAIEKLAGVCFYKKPKGINSLTRNSTMRASMNQVREIELRHRAVDADEGYPLRSTLNSSTSEKDVIVIVTRRVIIIIVY